MGWPPDAVPLPRRDSFLIETVAAALTDPFGWRDELLKELREGSSGPSHLCATAWVRDASGQQTLLVRHRDLGWSVPGGHVGAGESPEVAARRELTEEAGVIGQTLALRPLFVHRTNVGGSRPHHHWNLAYAVEVDRAEPLRAERDEVCWFEIGADPRPAPPDLVIGLAVLAQAPWSS